VQIEKKLARSISCDFSWGQTLYHIQDLEFSLHELPEVFTQFRKAIEKKSKVRSCTDTPLRINSPVGFGSDIPDIEDLGSKNPIEDQRAVIPFKGGASRALDRLKYYLWDRELLSTYKKTRNGLIGGDYSSKFSPWVSLGCISSRQIYWEVKKYEKYVKKNSSTYWLIFELIWRDYFHFVAKKYGSLLFQKSGITGVSKAVSNSTKFLHLWTEGRTNEPLIDANMNELNATGFMSNRGRQIVSSYLIYTMGIDWRLGAAYFEKMLIDYDPCSNYGNWAYIAGVGNDPRGGREFNILRQQETYDSKGTYRALWS
jgi:deoxyribodipyrimidine photo-lyase